MKNPLRMTVLMFLALATIGAGAAFGAECDGRYFAADDTGGKLPLRHPARELAATLRQARAGVAVEQRNLAVSYESGYLVSECAEDAAYWYEKAAASGDEIAKKWVGDHRMFAALRQGPECVDDHCGIAGDHARVAVLYSNANRNDHYFASVTINGRTAPGLIDTGASTIAMSAEMAKEFGIDSIQGRTATASTASGNITTQTVLVPLIEVAGIRLHNVPVSIGITGEMLIGMSFLKRLNVVMSGGVLTLSKR